MPGNRSTLSQPGTVLVAEPNWHLIDFISDLHLQASQRSTFAAWQCYLSHTTADAVFILGDLFEVWVGDDIAAATHDAEGKFVRECQQVLNNTAQRLPVYFMHGNRDFLLGPDFARDCQMTLLPDPTVLAFDDQRWLLSHGDALCLGDEDYQVFRQQVRSAAWRSQFLAQPLARRQSIARGLRAQSQARKASGGAYSDADTAMVQQWLAATQTTTLIHGHTHHPADHALVDPGGGTQQRRVLSDWDASANPVRLEVLRLRQGATPIRLSPALATTQ